jgi:hypothetical protein
MSKPIPNKVKPVGQPIDWTEADLDRLSQVTEEDKASAKAFWRRTAPRKLKRIVDAKKAK